MTEGRRANEEIELRPGPPALDMSPGCGRSRWSPPILCHTAHQQLGARVVCFEPEALPSCLIERDLEDGEVLFAEGERGFDFYVVESGRPCMSREPVRTKPLSSN